MKIFFSVADPDLGSGINIPDPHSATLVFYNNGDKPIILIVV